MGISVDNILDKHSNCKIGLSSEDLIVVEHRSNNPKRDFLFVNRFQGKHIPTMSYNYSKLMDKLTDEISRVTNDRRDILVIGFAETATAMAAEVADRLPGCKYYMQTTREKIRVNEKRGISRIVDFQEEHSHAVEQELYGDWKKICRTNDNGTLVINRKGKLVPNGWGYILLIDDEITTGKTVMNIVNKIKEKIDISDVGIGVASICNWQKQKDIYKFINEGIDRIALIQGEIKDEHIKLNKEVYDDKSWEIMCTDEIKADIHKIRVRDEEEKRELSIMERCGRDSEMRYRMNGVRLLKPVSEMIEDAHKICVVGTEEFMYIPGVLAQLLGSKNKAVKIQATTRSSIDIMVESEKVGIRNKVALESVYDKERRTYLYNLDEYDKVFVITDGEENIESFANQITNAFKHYGTREENIHIIQVY